MHTLARIGIAAFLTSCIAAPPSAAEPSRKVGELSTVTLLAVERPAKDEAGGLAFTFLVVRAPKASGEFTLAEPRDFAVDGRSYLEVTKTTGGKAAEPMTAVYGAADYAKAHPALKSAIGDVPADEGAVVLHTSIYGTDLPARAPGKIRIEVGWDTRTEPFEFAFAVP